MKNVTRLEELIELYFDHRLEAAERVELETLLHADVTNRKLFWEKGTLEGVLHEWGQLHQGREDTMTLASKRNAIPAGWKQKVLLLVGGLAVAVAVMAVWMRPSLPADSPISVAAEGEFSSNAVAVLSQEVEARWHPGEGLHARGSALVPGWLRLDSGLVVLDFLSGARVVLEGPAAVKLISKDHAFCESGRLTAEVPPQAKGFRIDSPETKVVDLGTSFGLHVGGSLTEVHVFKGEVRYELERGEPTSLTEGHAVRVDRQGAVLPVPAPQEAFVLPSAMEARVRASYQKRQADWLAKNAAGNADDSLVIHFGFDDISLDGRALANQAAQAPPTSDGVIIGAGRVPGRWTGKSALEFRRPTDRVRFAVPGEFASLTLTAWVRLDGLDRKFNSLFMGDGFEAGQVHWQLRSTGTLLVCVKSAEGNKKTTYESPVIFTPHSFGQWVHLAAVLDAGAGTVTHYVNGASVSTLPITDRIPMKIGQAELGNWNANGPNAYYPLRCFSGRMDDFALYRRALSESEIHQHFEMGAVSQ